MISIDIDNTEANIREVVDQAQAETVMLVNDGSPLAVVMSMVEYKAVEELSAELARSKSENSRESQ